MKTFSEHTEYPSERANDQRCIWMMAGIISYKLCDRRFECNTCPLDIALRNQSGTEDPSTKKPVRKVQSSIRLPLNRQYLYTSNHTWLEIINDHRIRFGIEQELTSAFLAPKSIILPHLYHYISLNQTVSWIIFEDGTFPIVSPAGGIVTNINIELSKKPNLLYDDPFGSGWLFEIDPKIFQFGSPQFIGFTEAKEKYKNDLIRFNETLQNALLERTTTTIGTTLPDGGIPLNEISKILGSKKYFDIVREIFHYMLP